MERKLPQTTILRRGVPGHQTPPYAVGVGQVQLGRETMAGGAGQRKGGGIPGGHLFYDEDKTVMGSIKSCFGQSTRPDTGQVVSSSPTMATKPAVPASQHQKGAGNQLS